MLNYSNPYDSSSTKNQLKKVTIHIGQYHVSDEPTVIYTLLGSCVSVCLFDPIRQIGGMNHILLPGEADLRHYDTAARYGINAMELLINRMIKMGGNRRYLEAKVFGGAHLLPTSPFTNDIGGQISNFAIQFLRKENITIKRKDVGGKSARKVYFHTDTGKVYIKRLFPTVFSKIIDEEKTQQHRIKKELRKWGDVTLFK